MFWSVLFYGSIWGIFESTVGYFLHLLPIRVGSFIWLPVACFFMSQVYKSTSKYSSIIYISLLSSSIKLINLFMPVSIDKVVNPAISIVLEGCAFLLILYAVNNKKLRLSPLVKTFLFNTSWRLFYLVYLLFVPKWMFEKSSLTSLNSLFEFLVISNLKSGIGIYIYFKFQEKIKVPVVRKLKPAFALLLFVINIICVFTL